MGSSAELHALIKQKRSLKNPYLIQFLGTNQDAIATAEKYGIDQGHPLTYFSRNVRAAMESARRQCTKYRSGSKSLSFTAKERELAKATFTAEERERAEQRIRAESRIPRFGKRRARAKAIAEQRAREKRE